MKKRILAFTMAALMLGASALPVLAEGEPTVTFTQNKKLEYSNVTTEGSNVNLGSTFEGVAPGEERSQTIIIKNENSRTADFYMSAAAIQELEKSRAEAKGAGYEIKLTAGNSVLYDSKLGGYGADNENAASNEGIREMNEALDEDILIATLSRGQQTAVVLDIYFDGEAMDNTARIDYSNAFGQLEFNFKVGYEDPTGTKPVYKVITKEGEKKIVKRLVEIVEEVVPLSAVATGDGAMIGVGALVLVAGILLVVIGKKKKTEEEA